MRGGETMESDVTLCGAGDGMSTRGEQHGSPLSVGDRKVLSMTLMDLNDNANRSPLMKHKLTPDDMENDNEVSSLDRSQRFSSLETSTASGLYFYDDDFNETNDFNDHYDYQNEIGNDSFFYGQKLVRTKSDTCLYELDLSMSERASSQGQSSCGYDAASSADLSLHSDQFSPCGSRPDSEAKLFSSISAADKRLYSTDSLDHDLNSSMLPEEFDIAACTAKKENYMLAFDRSPGRLSDGDDTYGDAWLSDARENVDEPDLQSDSECNSELGEGDDAGEVVYLSGDYVSNDQEPLLGMFASNASEAMADDTGRSDARILADPSEILVDLTEESSNSTTPVVDAPVEDSGCKSASTPSTMPSPSLGTGPNSTLDDYGSEILGELEPDLRTSADAYTSYAYDNIFFEAIQHPVQPTDPSKAIVSSAPVTGNLMIFSGEEEQLATLSEGDKEPKQRFLKRWSNYEGLNDVKMTNLATFATIKQQTAKAQPNMTTSSMRTSQSIESLPSESRTTSSTKMTTWQQMKKSRAPQTSWKKICQMKEIMKAEDSIYQDASKAKSVPNLSEMCQSTEKVEVRRRENKDDRDPSKRHSFTLFEIFRRAKSEEEEPQRMIPSPVYQRMFASLMKSAESEVGGFYLDNQEKEMVASNDGKQSLVRSSLIRSSEDSSSSKNCGVQTSFIEDATTKSVQTSTPPVAMRRYYSSLDISQRGHLVSMTRSTSDMGLSGRTVSSSPSKHLTNSMLFSRGQLPDLSFLNRPISHQRHKPERPRSDYDHRSHSRLGKSQNSIIIHKKHQSPKRLHNPHVRQLRQIDDSNPETADEIDVPPRKPKRTFAFEAGHDAHHAQAIPLRRLVPRSSSCESARSSSYHSSFMDQSSASHRSQSLDNAHYCQQRRSHSGSRSSSGSETRSDVSRMSVDSDLASSHRSDSSSGSKRLKSCLMKKRRSSRSNSPAPRSRRRHSTSYYESYSEDAPHNWDQYDHSLLHGESSQCACPQCHPPPPCCHSYRERRRHCRLSYPPCHAHRQCCCHGDAHSGHYAGGNGGCYDNCGCYDDYSGCHSNQYSGRFSQQSGCDDGKKKTVSFNEEVRYHSPRNSPFASPKHQVTGEGGRVLKSPPLRAVDRTDSNGPRRHSESSSVDSAFESESPPREFMISPTKLNLADQDDDQSDISVQSKTGLIDDLFRAVDYVQQHFAGAMDMREKSHLGTSADCPKIGSLLLTQLCPALYNLLGNGLRLRVRSFFGQVKNNVWKMVEESAELAPSMPVLSDIVKEVRSQLYLRNSSAKFNAFVFGLLNAKALDHWLQLLRTQVKLVRKHYDNDAILYIFTTVKGRHLFNDCIRALRPLASLPFRIECNLEYKYRSTFSDCSTPELPLSKSQDSEGLPELFEKTDVRQYIQQARDWIQGSKLSESAMDYLGQRFYREFGQFSQNKKANRWSLPPVETMISLANFFAKSPTEKPSPSLEEFALYLARVNQSLCDESERSEREKSYSRIEKIIQNGDFHRKMERDEDIESQQGAFGCSYRQTDYQFENRFQRVESEPTFTDHAHAGAIPKRNSLPEVSTAGMDQSQKRWSFGSSLINVFDKLLLDPSKQGEKTEKPAQDVPRNVQKMADLPKNMQRQDSPKNMQYSQTGKQEQDEDTPTPKASPIRTWKSVAESTGQVAPPSPRRSLSGSGAEAAPTSAGATPSSPLRTWKAVASPKSSCEGQDFGTPPEEAEDVNANTVPSPVNDDQEAQQQTSVDADQPAVRPNNLLIRHFNAPRSSSSCSGRLCRSQKGRHQHNPAKQYVQAVCNHVASNTDQLSFKKGDMMLVVRDFERDWFYCTRANKTGLVHKICVQRIWDPCDSY